VGVVVVGVVVVVVMMMMMMMTMLYKNKYIILIAKIKTNKIHYFREKSLIFCDLSPTCFGSFGPLSGPNTY
jgi:hypothetical protein